MRNPVFVGAATASVTWFLLDVVLEKPIKKLLRGKKKKIIKNKYGQVFVYDTDVDDGYTIETDEEQEEREEGILERWKREIFNKSCRPGSDRYPECLID